MTAHPHYRQHRHPAFDVGVIQLSGGFLPSGFGRVRLNRNLDLIRKGTQILLAGYPKDPPAVNGQPSPRGSLWGTKNRVSEDPTRRLIYDADSTRGQSGAPVLIRDAAGEYRVAGVHAYGASTGNSGRRIDPEILQFIDRFL